jgi:polysaccharide biosynthesis/export protein
MSPKSFVGEKIPTSLGKKCFTFSLLFMLTWSMTLYLSGCSGSRPLSDSNLVFSRYDSLGRIEDTQSALYTVRPGDQIKIISLEIPELDTAVTVSEDGFIPLRLTGPISVLGMTRSTLTVFLENKLSQFVKTHFTLSITITNTGVLTITFLGEVGHQGNLPIQGEVSILQAIAAAGGPTTESDLRHIYIFRRGDYAHPVEIDLSPNILAGGLGDVPTVKTGDTVYIPRVENIVRDLSNFFRDVIFLFSLFTLAR